MLAVEASPPPLASSPDVDDDVEGQPDPANGVAVAYVYDERVDYSWHHSIIELMGHDLRHSCRVMQGGYIAIHHGTDGLVQARNKAVQVFLEERPFADWFFWIDTDMGFAPDTVDQLMAVADPLQRPVVGGLCFAQREVAADGMGGWLVQPQPTLFDWASYDTHQGFVARLDYSRDTVTQVAGTGMACVLIHRSVFERMRAAYGMSWYSKIPNHSLGEMTSEDLSFCERLRGLRIPVFVHTGVKTTHRKSIWVDERVYDRMPPSQLPIPAGVTRWPLDGLKSASAPPSQASDADAEPAHVAADVPETAEATADA